MGARTGAHNKIYIFGGGYASPHTRLIRFMESELVSGFMTEHAAVVFVFFFLAEYGSIVLMCILTSILFLGGYLLIDLSYFFKLVHYILYEYLFID